jgi:trans-2-enoyl-CoA reductase
MSGQALTFKQPAQGGESLTKFLRLQKFEITSPGENEVLIQLLASPINPLEILVLQDKYPAKPKHKIDSEFVPGFDGVAKVIQTGSGVQELSVGDIVVPKSYGLGTWRTHAVVDPIDLIKINGVNSDNFLFAAILKSVVLAAYFLVEDLRKLQKGDWVIQNAGTSAISQMVAQFVRIKGAHTISVIHDRPGSELGQIVKQAISRDSDVVVEESNIDPAVINNGRKIVLGLDCVWGDSARRLADSLSNGAIFANYGLLGAGPGGPASSIPLRLGDIFWKQLTFRSYRTTAQTALRTDEELSRLLSWFIELFDSKQLKLPRLHVVDWNTQVVDLETTLKTVVENAGSSEMNKSKTLFLFT